jgi:predicted AlkP superfamily phosphohydrolase/phosphomutase
VEWGGHDALYGFRAHPPELAASIGARYGVHPAGVSCDGARRTAADYQSFVDSLRQGVQTKLHLTREMLRKGSWDLFMQVFSEAHCVGHQCWHLHDEGHPAHDPSVRSAIGDPVLSIYRSIDAAIGTLLEDAGDCTTFVFSSHGMAHWYGADFLLPEILFRLGVSCRPRAEPRALTPASLALGAGTRAWHLLPAAVRQRLRGVRDRYGPGSGPSTARPTLQADMSRSRCFHHRNGLALGGIRLNLAGREPNGMLRPGAESEAFCADLVGDLLAIVDERTGKPLIRRVLRVAERYRGPHLDALPDLVVEYDDAVATGSAQLAGGAGASVRISSPKIGVIEGRNSYGRSGEHRRDGLLIAAGPALNRGEIAGPVSVLDLAPTWTRLLGVEMEETDGALVDELMVPV